MKRTARTILCGLMGCVLVSAALAKKEVTEPPAWGVPQVFSNLAYGSESGDIGGMQVILFPGDGDTWAVVMIAEGVPKTPVLFKAQLNDSKLELTLPANQPGYENYGKFTGEISGAGLKLSLQGEEYGFLKRQCDRH